MRDRRILQTVFVDLDSTLADTRQRWHLIDRENGTDWVEYAMACAGDVPIHGTVTLVRMLFPQNRIIILSGRADEAASLTREWLSRFAVPYDVLILRGKEDFYVPNGEWKRDRIREWQNEHPEHFISLLIDDWPETKEVIEKELDIPVLMVNPLYNVDEYVPEAESVENREAAWTGKRDLR